MKAVLAAFLLLALFGCQPAPTVTAPVSAQPTDVGSAADPAVVDASLRGYLEASGRHVTI